MPVKRGTTALAAVIASIAIATPAQAQLLATGEGRVVHRTLSGELAAVAATSPRDVWAVGDFFGPHARNGDVLIAHFNGKRWRRVRTPNIGGTNVSFLTGVSATSRTDAWAVGETGTDPMAATGAQDITRTLILHWNGRSWRRVPSPNFLDTDGTPFSLLTAVKAISKTNAWAVGTSNTGAMLVHWNGREWKAVPVPGVTAGPHLNGVTATSAKDVWVAGSDNALHTVLDTPLLLHYDGTSWHRLPGSVPATASYEPGPITATSPHNAWAVTREFVSGTSRTVIIHSDGKTWSRVPSPNPSPTAFIHDLTGVAASSPTNALAVGEFGECPRSRCVWLVAHWNGRAWKRLTGIKGAPSEGHGPGVTFVSKQRAWIVGSLETNEAISIAVPAMVLWNGRTFKRFVLR